MLINIRMDPFVNLYCRRCHNIFMYCDCVSSYQDIFDSQGTSHDSESSSDSQNQDVYDPLRLKDPWGAAGPIGKDGNVVLVPKTPNKRPNQGVPDAPVKRKKDSKIDPSFATVKEKYYNSSGMPRPFSTNPSTTSLIAVGMPIYAGDSESPEFTKFYDNELLPWLEGLSPEDAALWNEGCYEFNVDPSLGAQNTTTDWVQLRYSSYPKTSGTKVRPGKHAYSVSYPLPDGSWSPTQIVWSDITLPMNSFSNKENFDKHYYYDDVTDSYYPRYIQPRSTRRLLRDETNAGDRFALKRELSYGIDDIAHPVGVVDPPPVGLINNVRNTRRLTGSGSLSIPFRLTIPYEEYNVGKFIQPSNIETLSGVTGAFMNTRRDNLGDPLSSLRWVSGDILFGQTTPVFNDLGCLCEMVNRTTGSSPTYFKFGITLRNIKNTQPSLVSLFTPTANVIDPLSVTNVFHEMFVNGQQVRNAGDASTVPVLFPLNVDVLLECTIVCPANSTLYDKSAGGIAKVVVHSANSINVIIKSMSTPIKINTDTNSTDPTKNTEIFLGEQVGFQNVLPSDWKIRSGGSLPANSLMQFANVEEYTKMVVFCYKAGGNNSFQVSYRRSNGAQYLRKDVIGSLSDYQGYIVPATNSNLSIDPLFGSMIIGNRTGSNGPPPPNLHTYEREVFFLTFSPIWEP